MIISCNRTIKHIYFNVSVYLPVSLPLFRSPFLSFCIFLSTYLFANLYSSVSVVYLSVCFFFPRFFLFYISVYPSISVTFSIPLKIEFLSSLLTRLPQPTEDAALTLLLLAVSLSEAKRHSEMIYAQDGDLSAASADAPPLHVQRLSVTRR